MKDIKIDFNNNINVLIGENGLGKTTILETIYNIITSNKRFLEDERSEGCNLEVMFTEGELNIVNRFRNRLHKEVFKSEEKTSVGKHEIKKELNLKKQFPDSIMLKEKWFRKVVYLQTDVNFKKHKVETAKKVEGSTEIGVILNSDEMSLNLKEYFVNIHYKDLEDMSIGDTPYRIQKFKQLYNAFFEEKEFLGVKDFEPLFKIKATGEIHFADELSAGEKQIFFRGGSLLQVELNDSIILIDEPELSLHHEWQKKY